MKLPIMTNKKGETDIVHTLCHGYKGHGNFEQLGHQRWKKQQTQRIARRKKNNEVFLIMGQIL